MATQPWPPSTSSSPFPPSPPPSPPPTSASRRQLVEALPLARSSGCTCCCFRRCCHPRASQFHSHRYCSHIRQAVEPFSSIYFNAYSSCGSQRLRAACEQWHSITLAAAHRASCCDGPVGGSFASGFFLLEFIVENRCDRERSNRIARVRSCLCRSADNPHACTCVSVFCCRSQEPQGR
jgi:hypothetical protein